MPGDARPLPGDPMVDFLSQASKLADASVHETQTAVVSRQEQRKEALVQSTKAKVQETMTKLRGDVNAMRALFIIQIRFRMFIRRRRARKEKLRLEIERDMRALEERQLAAHNAKQRAELQALREAKMREVEALYKVGGVDMTEINRQRKLARAQRLQELKDRYGAHTVEAYLGAEDSYGRAVGLPSQSPSRASLGAGFPSSPSHGPQYYHQDRMGVMGKGLGGGNPWGERRWRQPAPRE